MKPIPAKTHKTQKRTRKIDAKPIAYKPHPYGFFTVKEAKPIPHRRVFFLQKQAPVPKSPFKYKYKRETNLNGRFVVLLILLVALIVGFVFGLKYLLVRF